MVDKRFGKDVTGRTHRRPSKGYAHRPACRTAIASLALSGMLAVGGVAVLTQSATADVTAASAGSGGGAGRVPVVVEYDLAYMSDLGACPPEERGCLLDLYKKDGGSLKKPLVVLIHGGGWIRQEAEGGTGHKGTKRVVAPAKDLAKNGYVVLAIDYPGATDDVDGTPEEENAVLAAVDWAIANKLTHNINPRKIAFIGGSSGGQLSLLAAFKANKATPGKITMAYSLSGPTDLWDPLYQLQKGNAVPGDEGYEEGIPGFRNIELYLGCDWDGQPGAVREECTAAQAKAVSPLYYRAGSTCPLVRITRSDTEDMGEAEALDVELAKSGCRVTDPSVLAKDDPQVLAQPGGAEHGLAQWPDIRLDVIADLNTYVK